LRTRSGQPDGQVMPGTRKVAWKGASPLPVGAGALEQVSPTVFDLIVNSSRTDRKRPRIEPLLSFVFPVLGNDGPLEVLVADDLQKLLGRVLLGIVGDLEEVPSQIDVDLRNTWKP
jgi:hypothetical protein